MGYGTTAKLFVNGSGFGIEAGQLNQKAFTNALLQSQLLTLQPPWNTPGGITVTKMALASDMPVGGRNVFRILDFAGTAFYEQDAFFPSGLVDGDGSERPIVFSCYIALEAYPQDNSRIEARLTLANANTIDFSADFNPRNGQQVSTNFISTEPGFASGECAVFINAFEGMNGVSAFRINLTIFARGLTGASAISTMRLRLRPDTVGAVGSFLDVTAAQIAIPFGTTTTADFGLPPYVPTWANPIPSQNAKLTNNSLDLSYHFADVVTSPYQLDYYADGGVGKFFTAGLQYDLPVSNDDIANGWWTVIGSQDLTPPVFDIGIAAGQVLRLGSAGNIVGPAVHTVNNANVLAWKIVKVNSDRFGLFPLFNDPAGGGGVAEPANQIVFGTGASVTSNANFTFDPTTGLFQVGPIGFGNDALFNFSSSANTLFIGVESQQTIISGIDATTVNNPGGGFETIGGNGNGTGTGGALFSRAGTGGGVSGAGGNSSLVGGFGGSGGDGGEASLTGGEASSGGTGGGAFVVGGNGSIGGGPAELIGGACLNVGTGGTVNAIGGDGGTTSGDGGATTVAGGDATTSGDGGTASLGGGIGAGANHAGGDATVQGGPGSPAGGQGGFVTIRAGAPVENNGTDVEIQASNGVGTDRNGGTVLLHGGDATGTGTPGDIILNTGETAGTGTGGNIVFNGTNTAVVGAVTINKTSGRVNIAAAGTSVVVTNSKVSAASHVLAIASTADATARVTSVVPAAGSFTINTVAVTAQTSFDFFVFNSF